MSNNSKEYFVHESAFIDDGCRIGAGTKIWHFSHIMGDVIIGANCVMGQNTFIGEGVVIGEGVKIQNNVSVYSGVIIEDEVFVGPSVVFTNVINPRSRVIRKNEFKNTLIKKGSTIGANATVICGITLGRYSFVGAGAVVTKNVKNYEMVLGNPASHYSWMSERGNNLIFDEEKKALCDESGEWYQLLDDRVIKMA